MRAAIVLSAFLAVLTSRGEARAQDRVIGPGQEEEVLALFAPYALGDEIEDGFVLHGVQIAATEIRLTLRGPGDAEARVRLVHADAERAEPVSPSFGVFFEGPDEASTGRRRLLARVAANDRGTFWREQAVEPERAPRRSPEPTGDAEGESTLRRVALWGSSAEWGQKEWVPIDGIVVLGLCFLLALALAIRHLIEAPGWMTAALVGACASGLLLRWFLAPPTFLGAWPWSRLYPNVRAVAFGSGLDALSRWTGETPFLTDVAMGTNFAYAALMPLVVFSHASFLLKSPKAGLAVSWAIALLPQHIRFSRCEDGFIASLTLTSLAFALIHGFLRDPRRGLRVAFLLALPWVLYPGYLLRPLNILFVVVYVAALILLHGEHVPRARRGLGLGVVLAVGAAAAWRFAENHGEMAVEHVGPGLVLDLVRVVLWPPLLVLTDPTKSPVVLVGLAALGAGLAWKKGERPAVAFLLGWLVLFLVAHAVVTQESMQPRYHLHLVVPFLLLGALAVLHTDGAWWKARLASRPRQLAAGIALLSLALAPLLHLGFIQDEDYTELQEYRFVRAARPLVPAGCTVVEYLGGPPGDSSHGSRFRRIGAHADPERSSRFDVAPIRFGLRSDPGAPSLEGLVTRPPSCLFVYEGLPCTTRRDGADRCGEIRARFEEAGHGVELVREARLPNRLYDESSDPDDALAEAERVDVALYRVGTASPLTQLEP